jgi:hypothetical protein
MSNVEAFPQVRGRFPLRRLQACSNGYILAPRTRDVSVHLVGGPDRHLDPYEGIFAERCAAMVTVDRVNVELWTLQLGAEQARTSIRSS